MKDDVHICASASIRQMARNRLKSLLCNPNRRQESVQNKLTIQQDKAWEKEKKKSINLFQVASRHLTEKPDYERHMKDYNHTSGRRLLVERPRPARSNTSVGAGLHRGNAIAGNEYHADVQSADDLDAMTVSEFGD
jgi:hypothetical protein